MTGWRALLLAAVVAGCCPRVAVETPSTPRPPVQLTFIDDHNFAPSTMFEGLRFGGISALAFDHPNNALIALSDAHDDNRPARLYRLRLRLSERELDAHIIGMIRLGGAFTDGHLDPEGLAHDASGKWLISTEGNGEVTPRFGPALFRIDADGAVLSQHALPDAMTPTPTGELTHGVVHNKGLEGLTASPSGRVFFTVSEIPLVQDGPEASFARGGHLRILRLDTSLVVTAEHHYITEPVPKLASDHIERVLNGVSALCALDDERVLVMERAVVRAAGVYHNRIQVYEVNLAGAADVSALISLEGHANSVSKRLALDLDDVVAQFEEGKRSLDNFEAMALGPPLPSGQTTLLLASDDNFKDSQRTALLAFALQ